MQLTATKPEPEDEDDELFLREMSEDDYSSEEDVKASPSKPRARKNKSDKVLDLGLILKAPRATQYSTKTFYEMVKDELIDLEPEYQRGVVWPEHKQSAVIESIMRHYYVPPILLSVKDKEDNEERMYICIDGKQRLSSLQRFMDNEIPIKEPGSNRRFWYQEDLLNAKTPALSPAQKRRFDNEQLTCVEFDGLTEEIERDMFSRVQMGVTLSSAEKLAAHLGPWPELIRQLVKRYLDPTPEHPGLSADRRGRHIISCSRGKDYLFMAQISLLIVHATVPRYVPSASQVESFLKNNGKKEPSPAIKQQIHETLAKYVALANHPKFGKCMKPSEGVNATGRSYQKPLSPVEFVYIGFLIFHYRHLQLSQLYQMVQQMKAEVRPQYKDMMFNQRVAASLRNFIETVKPPEPLPEGDAVPRRKRYRSASTDDDDDDDDDDGTGEYVPTPTRRPRVSAGGSASRAAGASTSISSHLQETPTLRTATVVNPGALQYTNPPAVAAAGANPLSNYGQLPIGVPNTNYNANAMHPQPGANFYQSGPPQGLDQRHAPFNGQNPYRPY